MVTRWEEPVPRKMFVTIAHVAEVLDVPIWKAGDISWCLDRRYFGERAVRVSRAALEEYVELVDVGHPDPRSEMRRRRGLIDPLVTSWGLTERSAAAHRRRLEREGRHRW